jgi:hypothetical protein
MPEAGNETEMQDLEKIELESLKAGSRRGKNFAQP